MFACWCQFNLVKDLRVAGHGVALQVKKSQILVRGLLLRQGVSLCEWASLIDGARFDDIYKLIYSVWLQKWSKRESELLFMVVRISWCLKPCGIYMGCVSTKIFTDIYRFFIFWVILAALQRLNTSALAVWLIFTLLSEGSISHEVRKDSSRKGVKSASDRSEGWADRLTFLDVVLLFLEMF